MAGENESKASRWWEFYFVRYAVGTVLGGAIAYAFCMNNSGLKPILFDASKGTLDSFTLMLLLAYGLVYSYIASAPILVFHAGRFALKSWKRSSRKSKAAPLAILGLPVLVEFLYFYVWPDAGDPSQSLLICAVYLLSAVFLLQLFVVILTFRSMTDVYALYDKLAKRRENGVGGFVDSYRHLREHGNSFFIIFFEIVFGIIIFASPLLFRVGGWGVGGVAPADIVVHLIFVLLMWTFPAALIWFVGVDLEKRFIGAP